MPANNETWNGSGQPIGGTDDGQHFRTFKTLSDGTVVVADSAGASGGSNQVLIADSATLIVAANPTRKGLVIVQHGTTDVFLGFAGVTAVTGMLLTGTKGTAIGLPTSAALYGVVASGSQVVSYLEVFD